MPTITTDTLDVVLDATSTSVDINECDSLGADQSPDTISVELVEMVYVGGGGQTGRLHIEENFDFSDVDSPLAIGIGEDRLKVVHVAVEVTDEFDGDIAVSVGKESAQAILMTLSESDLSTIGIYSKETNLDTGPTDVFWAYFTYSVQPTRGAGRITILYN